MCIRKSELKFELTAREKSELLGEGIITAIILALLNFSTFVALDQWIKTNPGLQNGIFQIKMSLAFGPDWIRLWNWGWIFIFCMVVADIGIIYCRALRRYRQMQLWRIIGELHYIASGHFNHRIPFKVKGPLQKVINSVNALVDSTMKAMEDERRIERSKDELVTNVSHDIRTPLTSIIGYLGLIENKQYHSEKDLLKYVHTAYEKSKQMKVLVDDLFEYTKVHQVDAPIKLNTIDVGQLLEQIAASFEYEANKHHVKIEVNLPKEPIMIQADGEKLARVFNNLMSNAFKYGYGATKLVLSLTKIGQNEIEIRVSNNGEPIPKDAINKVFDRFYRAEASRSRETGGTGLGLAIVQGIINLHQGQITAESDEELTSFIIDLPIDPKEKVDN